MNNRITIVRYVESTNAAFLFNYVNEMIKLNESGKYDIVVYHSAEDSENYPIPDNDKVKAVYTKSKNWGQIWKDDLGQERINDILIVEYRVFLTDKLIEQLSYTAYSDKNIGLVGHTSSVYNYPNNIIRVLAPSEMSLLYIKRDTIDKINGFDTQLSSLEASIRDFCFRALEKGYYTVCAKHNGFFDINNISEITESDTDIMQSKWNTRYFNINYNPLLLNAMDTKDKEKPIRVLEVGCDMGANLLEIENRFPNSIVDGIEVNAGAVRIARYIVNGYVSKLDITNPNAFSKLKSDYYDYILFGDVLEHLSNPLEVLESCRNILKSDGKIIACIPNLMHISVMKQLLCGKFTYTDFGLLDKTHIHFFTRYEILEMFDSAGYKVDKIKGIYTPVSKEDGDLLRKLMGISANCVSLDMYTTFQYICIAEKRK